MPKLYLLRPDGNYSDAAEYPAQPADRADGQWVEGVPDGLSPYAPVTLIDQLKTIFASVPIETQAQLGPLAASVFLFVSQENPPAAKLVIQSATVPSELEDLKAQMLALFPA